MTGCLFTIGCSTHSIEAFLKLLKDNSIKALADVRSVPYSKFTPQFNENELAKVIKAQGIHYLSFSAEFGARRTEAGVFVNGKVNFDLVQRLEIFKSGITRIKQGLEKDINIALMCTEKDPIDCHRFILVSHAIEIELGIAAKHILFDGNLESTNSVEKRMLIMLKLTPTLFAQDVKKLKELAYQQVAEKIAYKELIEGDDNA